jgi:hypothetical protein
MRPVTQRGKREKVFLIGLAVSLLIHLALLGVAPRVKVFDEAAMRRDATRMFRIRPVDVEPPPRPVIPARYEEPPASLDEFLLRERERPDLPPVPEYPREELEMELSRKIVDDRLTREHAPEPAATTLEAIELEVVAIHKRLLGERIDVTRRLIPEKERVVLPPDIMPTISGPGAAGGGAAGVAKHVPTPPPPVTTEERAPEPAEVLREAKVRETPGLERELLEGGIERSPLREEPRLVQKYPSLDDLLDVYLTVYNPPGEDGYFLIRILPKRGGTFERMPKEMIFVIDASKSIREAKLQQSKQGLEACLAELNPSDVFNVIAFKDSPMVFRSSSVPPTPANIRAARGFVKDLKPTGETDVYSAIAPLVRSTKPNTHPYNIFLISDGKPTTGMVDSRAIINNLTRQNELNASIFTFGGGTEVNVYLLDLLAYLNKGRTYIAEGVYDIDTEMPAFYQTIKDPILIDLRANYANLDESEIYPKVLPDFYLGGEIIVTGRYSETTVFSMRLTGMVKGQKKELVFKKEFARAEQGGEEIGRLWAFNKIYKLIADMCQQGATPQLVEEIRRLGQKYNIATAYSPTGT